MIDLAKALTDEERGCRQSNSGDPGTHGFVSSRAMSFKDPYRRQSVRRWTSTERLPAAHRAEDVGGEFFEIHGRVQRLLRREH